jgi:hypothetical protein
MEIKHNKELQWYSVEEKLPLHNVSVLTVCKPKYWIEDQICDIQEKMATIRTGTYCDIDKIWALDSPDLDDIYVYFWAYIPELPKFITDNIEVY